MTPFDLKCVENPLFLKWIFNTNPDIETYWEQYQVEHPENKKQLLELRHCLIELEFTNDMLLPFERKELESHIKTNITLNRKNKSRRLLLTSFMKYAAVALIFATIGGMAVYFNIGKFSDYQEFARKMVMNPTTNQGPTLITSNGENVSLKKSNSTVDYAQNGAIVLNNDSVIQANVDAPKMLNQIIIPYGNQSRVVLSDSTVVWLNAGSRLIYPTLFKDKTREVMLIGEAFFDVAKNPAKPFIVKTSGIDIKVLGTQFNVSAYEEDEVIQTVLKEGSVDIRSNGSLFFEHSVVIKPDQMATFNKTSSDTKVYNVNADTYTLWTKGLISFEDIDLNRVIKKVERFYNISVSFSDPEKKIMRISGKLDLKQGRKEVMEYLEKVSLSRFEQIKEDKYIIK
jgi:transmembrane sensor